jgi:hypothetical protein
MLGYLIEIFPNLLDPPRFELNEVERFVRAVAD